MFYPDMNFGSYLYRLKGKTGGKYEQIAMEYVMQALDCMPDLLPEKVDLDGENAHVTLWLQGRRKEVTVAI